MRTLLKREPREPIILGALDCEHEIENNALNFEVLWKKLTNVLMLTLASVNGPKVHKADPFRLVIPSS